MALIDRLRDLQQGRQGLPQQPMAWSLPVARPQANQAPGSAPSATTQPGAATSVFGLHPPWESTPPAPVINPPAPPPTGPFERAPEAPTYTGPAPGVTGPLTPPPVEGGSGGGSATFGPDTDWSNPANLDAYFASRGVTLSPQSRAYWLQRFSSPEFAGDRAYFFRRLSQADEFGGGGGGGNVFSDPATIDWENLIRTITGQLTTPRNNPDLNPLIDYMRQYFKELQGAAYTPAQRELYQTQALDPLTRERDKQKQDILLWAAQHGQDPNSGPVQSRLQDLDQKFAQVRTGTQAQLATSEIEKQKQQQQQALAVGTALSGLQNNALQTDEDRLLQALQVLGLIPQMANTRLGLANQTLGGQLSPVSLLQLLMSGQQQGSQQNNDFWNQLGLLFGSAFQ